MFVLGRGTDNIMGDGGGGTHKFKVFLYANEISTFNAYSILYGKTVSCCCLLYLKYVTMYAGILFVTVCNCLEMSV